MIIVCGGSMHLVKIGAVFAAFIKPILLNWYVRKNYMINWKAKPNEKSIAQRWNAFFQQVAVVVNENISLVILTVLQPLSAVSVFTVHSMVVFNIRAIVNSFTSGINSTFGSMIAAKEYENLKNTLFFSEWLIYAIACVLYSVTAVMLTPFVSLYTAFIIDVDYYGNESNEGHMFVSFTNHGKKEWVNEGLVSKMNQGIFMPYYITRDDNVLNSVRKGGFGSTSK